MLDFNSLGIITQILTPQHGTTSNERQEVDVNPMIYWSFTHLIKDFEKCTGPNHILSEPSSLFDH